MHAGKGRELHTEDTIFFLHRSWGHWNRLMILAGIFKSSSHPFPSC